MSRCIEPGRLQIVRSILKSILLGLLLTAVDEGSLIGQEKSADSPVTTLRIYENLVQVPVVVLGPTFEFMRPFAARRFYVSLDSGPPFQATHVRFEGDDPIALSILIDLNAYDVDVTDLGHAIAHLAPRSLQSRDRVSIYALRHCEMWHVAKDAAPALNVLGEKVSNIKQDWPGGWKKQQTEDCRHRVMLLDGLTQVIGNASTMPGRRVVLVLSDGKDAGSKRNWVDVKEFATSTAVTVFGLRETHAATDGFFFPDRDPESAFRVLCESSGGLVFSSTVTSLRYKLNDFMELLRKRYIVEFPRPDDIETGRHTIEVTISKSNPFIRSSGITVPTADPETLSDPNTIRTDPAHAPTVGKRKPLAVPQ